VNECITAVAVEPSVSFKFQYITAFFSSI